MKKIFMVFLVFIFSFGVSFANEKIKINEKLTKINLNIYIKKLKTIENGEKYIEVIDKKINSFSEEELWKYKKNLENYLRTYKGKYFNLLKYFKFKIDFVLLKGDFGKKVDKNNLIENNFKIYKNKEFGFEILQEKDFDIISKGNGILFLKEKDNEAVFVVLLVDYYSVAKIRKISDYIDFLIKTDISKIGKNIKKEKLNISGLEGYKISYEGKNYLTGSNYNEIYIFGNEEKGIVYNISFFDKDYKYKEKIINSFKMNKNIDKDFIIKKQKELEEINLKESRDTSRRINLKLISKKLEIDYIKNNFLVNSLNELKDIIDIIKDKKDGEIIDGCKFGYNYEKISDISFRLSTCMETENGKKQAKNDGGIYDDKFEIFYEIK